MEQAVPPLADQDCGSEKVLGSRITAFSTARRQNRSPAASCETALSADTRPKGPDHRINDERVFDQFPVLGDIYSVMTAPGRAGGAGIREDRRQLLFERSTALRPDRRARFATASAQALEITAYNITRDGIHIGRSWELEMAGELPLSVIICWSGQHPKLLAETLASLSRPETPGHEVLVVCDKQKAADEAAALCQNHPQVQVIVQSKTGTGPARNSGLDAIGPAMSASSTQGTGLWELPFCTGSTA